MNSKSFAYMVGGVLIGLLTSIALLTGLSNKLETSEHNLLTARDSVRTLVLKNGEQVSTINSYILEKKQLQEYLDITKTEIKELEKRLGSKLAYVSNIKTEVSYDTIAVTDTIWIQPDGTMVCNIDHHDEWIDIHGTTSIKDSVATTTFDNINVPVPLQVGLTNDYQIWVKSKNPYLNITDIEGAVVSGSNLNKKTKRWSVGLQGGIGMQYGIVNKRIDVGPYVGIGVSYHFFSF